MVLVVASIGSEGLLGTEALQSCLPHQLDLRTGQLWADGQSTLQLHEQWQATQASVHLKGSLVLPPDSEIVAPVSIRSSGIQPGLCSLIESKIPIYGKLSCVGDLVPVSAQSLWLILRWSLRGSVGHSWSTWRTLLRVLILPWEWRGGLRSRITYINMLMCFLLRGNQ